MTTLCPASVAYHNRCLCVIEDLVDEIMTRVYFKHKQRYDILTAPQKKNKITAGGDGAEKMCFCPASR